MKYSYVVLLPFVLASCKSRSMASIGITGLIALFGGMFLLFAFMFFLIAKRKKQGERSLVKFNNDIHLALDKLDTQQQKINMLKNLVERINNDEKYAKDTEWRDKVLVKTYMHLATIYYHSGQDLETLKVCSKIIELDQTDGMAYYNRGSIYSNMGIYEKALQDFNRTIELLPDYASAYNNRGLVYEKLEHYKEALADFDEAIKLEGSAISYYNRGNTYFELDKFKEALADYRQALGQLEEGKQSDLRREIETSIKVTEEKAGE